MSNAKKKCTVIITLLFILNACAYSNNSAEKSAVVKLDNNSNEVHEYLLLTRAASFRYGPLVTPPEYGLPIRSGIVKAKCGEMPVAYAGDMAFPSKYKGSDSARDHLNKPAEQRYQSMTNSIKLFERNIAGWSDDYLLGSLEARNCLVRMLVRWGEAGALLSKQTNNMGQSVRKWALATAAQGYLKVTQSSSGPVLNDYDKQTIEGWLLALAIESKAYYSDRPLNKVNNHDYWAAWAVAQVGVILNREDLFEWSMKKLALGLSQINSEGLLANEMRRKTRALYYHNYALQPLSWLIVYAQVNGYSVSDQQLLRFELLAKQTTAGLDDPSLFKQLTGEIQYVKGLYTSYNLVWMEVWSYAFSPQAGMEKYLTQYRPMKATRMGGDVSRLLRANTKGHST